MNIITIGKVIGTASSVTLGALATSSIVSKIQRSRYDKKLEAEDFEKYLAVKRERKIIDDSLKEEILSSDDNAFKKLFQLVWLEV